MTVTATPTTRHARWQDYVQPGQKPRVMSLVVFTGLTGLIAADRPMNPFLAATAVFCIAVGAGASASLNMWYDADIDQQMKRTRGRPVPAGRVQGADALALGIVLSLLSCLTMYLAIGLLPALLLAFTIFFYAVVYTMWLKRWTVQNIVIGGLAGALPPGDRLKAARGHGLSLNAWLMCAIIFMWTPPHFWALSLYTSEDYGKAGVPMAPRWSGERAQDLPGADPDLFAVCSIPLCQALLALTHLGHWLYGAVSLPGGVVFLILAWRLFKSHAGEGGPVGENGLYDVKAGSKDARTLVRSFPSSI